MLVEIFAIRIAELESKLGDAESRATTILHDLQNMAAENRQLQSKLEEALERDRKGDQIIIDLTLDRDNLARRLNGVRLAIELAARWPGEASVRAHLKTILDGLNDIAGESPNPKSSFDTLLAEQEKHDPDL